MPGDGNYRACLGICFQNMGNAEMAISNYEEAIKLKEDFVGLRNNWGSLLDIGDNEKAFAILKLQLNWIGRILIHTII